MDETAWLVLAAAAGATIPQVVIGFFSVWSAWSDRRAARELAEASREHELALRAEDRAAERERWDHDLRLRSDDLAAERERIESEAVEARRQREYEMERRSVEERRELLLEGRRAAAELLSLASVAKNHERGGYRIPKMELSPALLRLRPLSQLPDSELGEDLVVKLIHVIHGDVESQASGLSRLAWDLLTDLDALEELWGLQPEFQLGGDGGNSADN